MAEIFAPQAVFQVTFQPKQISERNRYLVSLGILWDPFQTTPRTPIPAEVLVTGSVKSINHSGISSSYCDASSTATNKTL